MWKEVFEGDTAVDRLPNDYFADEESSLPSRRVSAASDDSFDASCYVHVDNKLKSKMPKCLLNVEVTEADIENHFVKSEISNGDENVTKSGKRVIRKRLSISQFKAARMHEKNSNNNSSNARSDHANNNDISSSSDSDTMQKPTKMEKPNTNVLSAKIQHLLFEMKRLRQLDRDILRKFLVINDTIEEQKWMVEEKQAAIKRSLSEEGEDPVTIDMHFDLVQEVPEEDDDEESIQSVLSRQNSGCEVYNDTLAADELEEQESAGKDETITSPSTSNADLAFTSSESALSLSGASSTLSSTSSFPASNRSTSPPTSQLSGSSSRASSFVSSSEQNHPTQTLPISKSNPTPPMPAYPNDNDIPVDIEGYYRMYGSAMKRGTYPFPTTAHSRDGVVSLPNGHVKNTVCDDAALDNAYVQPKNGYRRASDAPEYVYATRKMVANMAPLHEQQRTNGVSATFRPRSASATSESLDARNRVQRISVRPDGTRELSAGQNGLRRPYSANDKTSAAYRLLQHPVHQRRIARMNANRQPQQWSFVPIEEQEPDMMYDNGPVYNGSIPNGRIYSSESSSKVGPKRQEYHNIADLSKAGRKTTDQRCYQQPRQCPPPKRKPSGTGSAGSLTSSSSQTSSSSLASSSSNSSLHSPTKFMTNEVERVPCHPMMPQQEPVWVQRRRHSQASEYIAIPYNRTFLAPRGDSQFYGARQYGAHNLPAPDTDCVKSARAPVPAKRTSLSRSYRSEMEDPDNILTVSYKPNPTATNNQAVYNWIQTQDDVTYL